MPAATPTRKTLPLIPFTASAHEYTELAFTRTVTPTTAVQNLDPIDLPAYGYFRNLWIGIEAAGGAGAGVGTGDYPWNIIQSVSLHDVNGGNIVGPINGYALYLANVVGGYVFTNPPELAPGYDANGNNPKIYLRVPVEISASDGFGALANQNAAGNYKLSLSVNSVANIWATAPTTLPVITITSFIECWTIPASTTRDGRPQMQAPPLSDTGQFWSSSSRSINIGDNNPAVNRVGSYIRNLICVYRTAAGVRSDSVAPSTIRMTWDGVQFHGISQAYAKEYFRNKINGPYTVPVGVYAFPFNHSVTGRMGNDRPDLWLPTSGSSRLEIGGTSAAAGTVEFLVNDIAPVEVDQAERYQVPSDTGRVANP